MLRSLMHVEGYVIQAKDGELGHCHDFLFDDELWVVRYMVAATGGWLRDRKVLVSPAFLESPDWETRHFPVDLTLEQIEQSPPLDADAPVSRRYEKAFHTFYSLFPYWAGSGLWAGNPDPSGVLHPVSPPPEPGPEAEEELERVRLRSAREIAGYHLQARDQRAGRVVDFLVDDRSWAIPAVVVDSMPLLPGHRVLLPTPHVLSVDWAEQALHADVEAEDLRHAPAFEPDRPISAETEIVLYDAKGRPVGHRREQD